MWVVHVISCVCLSVASLCLSLRSVLVDGEPVHTLRGHTGSILSMALGNEGDICFSAGVDCGIRCWQLPIDGEPFDEYGTSVVLCAYVCDNLGWNERWYPRHHNPLPTLQTPPSTRPYWLATVIRCGTCPCTPGVGSCCPVVRMGPAASGTETCPILSSQP